MSIVLSVIAMPSLRIFDAVTTFWHYLLYNDIPANVIPNHHRQCNTQEHVATFSLDIDGHAYLLSGISSVITRL